MIQRAVFAFLAILSFPQLPATATPAPVVLYVATNGNDAWSGRRPAPKAAKTDRRAARLDRNAISTAVSLPEPALRARLDSPGTHGEKGTRYFFYTAAPLCSRYSFTYTSHVAGSPPPRAIKCDCAFGEND